MAQLQNIPSRAKPGEYDERVQDLGPRVREEFTATPGHKLIVSDLSQIELRLGAHFTGDPTLMKVYKQHIEAGEFVFWTGDIHAETSRLLDAPRKLAKCLDGSTIINVNGLLSPIESILSSLEPGDHRELPMLRLADGRGGYATSSWGIVRKERPCKIVVTRRAIVCCTADHRWLLDDHTLVEARNLTKGMKLPIANVPLVQDTHPCTVCVNPFTREIGPSGAKLVLDESWAYFAGIFQGDGSMTTEHACVITHGSGRAYASWRSEIDQACKTVGLNPRLSKDERSTYLGSRTVVRFLESISLRKGRNTEPRVPWWVAQGGRKIICSYLAGLIDTDGSIDDHVNITQKSPVFIGQLAVLFRSIGCPVTIEPSWNKTYKRWYYRIRVLAPGILTVASEIHLRERAKLDKLRRRAARIRRAARRLDDEVLQVVDAGNRTVYDFHVNNEDHLYLQGGLIGHNNLNFGLMYGMGAAKFARYARLFKPGTKEYDLEASVQWVNRFQNTYAGVFDYHRRLYHRYAGGQRHFRMISGRLRHFPRNARISAGTIYNSKIQGSAGDVMKVHLWAMDKYLLGTPEFELLRPILQVHDEYVFECPEELAQKYAVMIKFIQEHGWFDLRVPVLASTKICNRWADKDDDAIPEVGTFCAVVDGSPRLFKATDWSSYLDLEKTKKVEAKSCVAMLNARQREWARSLLPANLPLFGQVATEKTFSLEEWRQRKMEESDD